MSNSNLNLLCAEQTCSRCRRLKSPSAFSKNARRKNGLDVYCRTCKAEIIAPFLRVQIEKRKAKKGPVRFVTAEEKQATDEANRAKKVHKIKLRKALYYAANVDKIRARNALYRDANRHKIKARSAALYSADPAKLRALSIAWYKANPDARRSHGNRRRARVKNQLGLVSKDIIQDLLKLQRGKCACCAETLGKNYQLDHVIPLALGGMHDDGNLQLLRARCNQKKGSKDPIEYMQSKGMLL